MSSVTTSASHGDKFDSGLRRLATPPPMSRRVECSGMASKVIPGALRNASGGRGDAQQPPTPSQSLVSFSPHGLVAFNAGADLAIIVIVDVLSAQVVQTLVGHTAAVTALCWKVATSTALQSNVCLYSADRKGIIVMWDVTEGSRLVRVQWHPSPVVSISCSSSPGLLTIVSADGLTAVTDSQLNALCPREPRAAAFKPNNRRAGCNVSRCCVSSVASEPLCALVDGESVHVVRPPVLTQSSLGAQSDGISPAAGFLPLFEREIVFGSDGESREIIKDAFFSTIHPEVLFVATSTSVSVYDWVLELSLIDQLLWRSADQGFERIFPSHPSPRAQRDATSEASRCDVELYTFTNDAKLTAWYHPSGQGQLAVKERSLRGVGVDIRGHRLTPRQVASVAQAPRSSNEFAVSFTDGGLALWRLHVDDEVWELFGFIAPAPVASRCIAGSPCGERLLMGSETGLLSVWDALHNRAERLFGLTTSAANCSISGVASHDSRRAWIATTKTVTSGAAPAKHFTQVMLFDVVVGDVEYVLRPPPSTADPGTLLEMALDPAREHLLVTFSTNAFEVWSLRSRSTIHMQQGYNLAAVLWGPVGTSVNLAWADTVLLATVPSEGGIMFHALHDDHLTNLRETFPLRLANGESSISQVCIIDDCIVAFDASGGASATRCAAREKWKTGVINQFPRAPAIHVAPCPRGKRDAENRLLVCVCFADGAFGVWDVASRTRCGYSRETGNSWTGTNAVSSCWLSEDFLAVLCDNGCIVVVDRECSSLNSTVYAKCISRVMRSPVFLLPAHAAHLQTALEWRIFSSVSGTSFAGSAAGGCVPSPLTNVSMMFDASLAPGAAATTPGEPLEQFQKLEPSFIIKNTMQDLPFRTPFGTLVSEPIEDLADELALYLLMIPDELDTMLQAAIDAGDVLQAAFLVARYFGQHDKELFWAAIAAGHNVQAPGHASQSSSMLHEWFHCARDALFPAVGGRDALREAKLGLASARAAAIQRHQSRHFDNAQARLVTSRSFVALNMLQEACDILIDSPFEFDSYAQNATLACAIAGCIGPRAMPLVVATKRAAAMLLAKGDVDGAVEKFSLIGEYYEACLALQSRGRWHGAAALANLAPMAESSRVELLQRWAMSCARKGELMTSARILISLGAHVQAIVLLAESTRHLDLAGLLAAMLVTHFQTISRDSCSRRVASPSRIDDDAEPPPFQSVIQRVLSETHSLLISVHNRYAADRVNDIAKSLDLVL